MRIGIMGAPINNPNHGCLALLYSLMFNLSSIEKERNEVFEYIIFDWEYNEENIKMMAQLLKIDAEKIHFAPYVMMVDPVRVAYHFNGFINMIREIKRCDCVIDVTEGDSFSDIYGDGWLRGRTRVKLLVEKLKIPLLLAPQTYGPYIKEKNRNLAVKSIQGANGVLTRDKQSQELIRNISGVEASFTTDLAFSLPCGDYPISRNEKINVGINASNLLYFSTEMKDRKFSLSVDYKKYLEKILDYLCNDDRYEIFFISHVDIDNKVHEELKKQYPSAIVVPKFRNPIEAKSCISKMDVFIGARMHGTIAAFTTGVACIPTAYSPKFSGLFTSLGYYPIIDLSKIETTEAVEKTIQYIEQFEDLKSQVQGCLVNNQELIMSTKRLIGLWLEKYELSR